MGIRASGQVTLAPGGPDAVPVEAGVNARQALSPILAYAAGVVVGAGTGTLVIKGGNVTTTRITATTDNAGNRSQVTLSLPPDQLNYPVTPTVVSYYFPSSYYAPAYFPFGKVTPG